MSSNAKAALIVVVAFVAGLFVGIAGDRFVLLRAPRHGSGRLVAYLARELKLTDQQRAQVEKIVSAHRSGMEAQMHKEIDAANAEIESVLTPDQRTKFREMRARAERRRSRGGFFHR